MREKMSKPPQSSASNNVFQLGECSCLFDFATLCPSRKCPGYFAAIYAVLLQVFSLSYTCTVTNNCLIQLKNISHSKPVSYTHLRAHETRHDLVCRLLLEKKLLNFLEVDCSQFIARGHGHISSWPSRRPTLVPVLWHARCPCPGAVKYILYGTSVGSVISAVTDFYDMSSSDQLSDAIFPPCCGLFVGQTETKHYELRPTAVWSGDARLLVEM